MASAAALICCANVGKFVWVEDLPVAPTDPATYVLRPGDVVSVRIYNQDGMSARAKVRSDGRISLPFLNDVEVAGYTPTALAEQLRTRLKEFVNVPVVTVSLEEAKALTVSVVGEVGRQGVFQIEPDMGLLQLLAMAGGLNEMAHRDRIFVMRQRPEPIRIRFTYDKLSRAEGRSASFRLEPGDIVVVE